MKPLTLLSIILSATMFLSPGVGAEILRIAPDACPASADTTEVDLSGDAIAQDLNTWREAHGRHADLDRCTGGRGRK